MIYVTVNDWQELTNSKENSENIKAESNLSEV